MEGDPVGGDPDLSVRDADEADLDAIATLAAASLPGAWPRATWAAERARADAHLAVAVVGGQVVGFSATRAVLDEVELLQLATAPAHRRRGVGAALLAALVGRALAAGARVIALEVRAGNVAARALYAGAGFAVIATRRGYYADGEDAVVMHCYSR